MQNAPHPTKIYRTASGKLGLEWMDHSKQVFDLRALRLACPCAACVDEWTGQVLLDSDAVPADVGIERVQSVGRYALGISWSDGHRSGIYTYKRLYEMQNTNISNKNV